MKFHTILQHHLTSALGVISQAKDESGKPLYSVLKREKGYLTEWWSGEDIIAKRFTYKRSSQCLISHTFNTYLSNEAKAFAENFANVNRALAEQGRAKARA